MHTAADPARTPTFTFFGDPNFFFESFGSTSAEVFTGDSWNHGDIQPEIGRTFIGIVGPGVRNLGVTEPNDFFTDHVDVRPTMMYLAGLKDDYRSDGRVVLELLDHHILTSALHAHSATLLELGQIYKQINAPFGELAKSTLSVSTYALKSDSEGDATYNTLESTIGSWTERRDALTDQMKRMLERAEFDGKDIDEREARRIIREGQWLLDEAGFCAFDPAFCSY
jgi:hypothetical protein